MHAYTSLSAQLFYSFQFATSHLHSFLFLLYFTICAYGMITFHLVFYYKYRCILLLIQFTYVTS